MSDPEKNMMGQRAWQAREDRLNQLADDEVAAFRQELGAYGFDLDHLTGDPEHRDEQRQRDALSTAAVLLASVLAFYASASLVFWVLFQLGGEAI